MTLAILFIAAVLLALDWRQTLRIAREPRHFYEKWNLVLSAHPTARQVHLWFGIVSISCAAIVAVLWQYPFTVSVLALLFAALELACVVNNFRAGIKP